MGDISGRRQRARRALAAEEGHSTGEQSLYHALWSRATPETAETRLITVGYGAMQQLCRRDRTNCKKNILSLISKLAVEVAGAYDVRRNAGNTYRIYSTDAIVRRRRAAGLEWVIRTSGVRFVKQPLGDSPIGALEPLVAERQRP